MAGTATHYERLGVLPSATPEQIRAAYRELARRHHPDVADDAAAASMAAVNEAWYVLGDRARRAEYDATLAPSATSRPQPPRRAATDGDEPEPDAPVRPSWWNEPLDDDPRLDVPITDGRAVRTFGYMVAIAAALALGAVTALFAYAIFWSG